MRLGMSHAFTLLGAGVVGFIVGVYVRSSTEPRDAAVSNASSREELTTPRLVPPSVAPLAATRAEVTHSAEVDARGTDDAREAVVPVSEKLANLEKEQRQVLLDTYVSRQIPSIASVLADPNLNPKNKSLTVDETSGLLKIIKERETTLRDVLQARFEIRDAIIAKKISDADVEQVPFGGTGELDTARVLFSGVKSIAGKLIKYDIRRGESSEYESTFEMAEEITQQCRSDVARFLEDNGKSN